MSLTSDTIRYIFEVDEKTLRFEINIDPEKAPPATAEATTELPHWTRLDHEQCACCPLRTETTPHCPAAVRLHQALEAFRDLNSINQVRLTVETSQRSYVHPCDLQSGLNSMIGLIMATSGCPVVGKLRSMATFHMPFCSFPETLYRSVSAYLVKQYFIHQEGGEPDWTLEGLKSFYDELESLNQAFSARIGEIERSDAISNAMIMFFSTSIVAASAIEEQLEEYKDYFTGASIHPPD
ncbi:MAG: DUF6901 family protein [Opitutales bacterium]